MNRSILRGLCLIISIGASVHTMHAFSIKEMYQKILPQKLTSSVEQYDIDARNLTTVMITNDFGSVSVKTWNQPKISVKEIRKAYLPSQAKQFKLNQKKSKTGVHLCAVNNDPESSGGLDVDLIIPQECSAVVTTNQGSIKTKSVNGAQTLTADKGSIEVHNATAPVVAQTKVKGGITVYKALDTVQATANTGDIALYDMHNSVQAYAKYGKIELYCKQVPTTSTIKLDTTTGTIYTYLPVGTNADVQASTKHGVVTCQHHLTIKPFATQLDRRAWNNFKREVNATMGNGEAAIKLSSVNSNIQLLKQSIS